MAMMRLLALQTVAVSVFYCVLFSPLVDTAVAQTTGTVSPMTAPAEPSPNEEPRPGDCMPIGLTASGEIVFPFRCKDFIERNKAARPKSQTSDEGPATAKEKPTQTDEKPAVTERPISTDEEKAAVQPTNASDERPTAVEEKPAVPAVTEGRIPAEEDKASAKPAESVAAGVDRPQPEQAGRTSPRRQVELETRKHAAGPRGCTGFRSYNPASQTYRSYDGQLRQCR
jgi:BA14K-like protein